jgi:photosystem II protein
MFAADHHVQPMYWTTQHGRELGPLHSSSLQMSFMQSILTTPAFPALPSLQENELFVGRVAQLGFAASLIGEIATGKGPLEQLGLETGIPLYEIEGVLAAFILFLFFAAINPGSGKFINNGDA